MKDPEQVKKGRTNRKKGVEFEKSVRDDLVSKGWIVTKFDNDIEFGQLITTPSGITCYMNKDEIEKHLKEGGSFPIPYINGTYTPQGKIIQAKKSFNPVTKRLGYANGFPDFVCIKPRIIKIGINCPIHKFCSEENCKENIRYAHEGFEVQLVEAKKGKYLDKEEKAKCEWIEKELKIPVFVAFEDYPESNINLPPKKRIKKIVTYRRWNE